MIESLFESIVGIVIIGGIMLGIEFHYGFFGISFLAILALLILKRSKNKTQRITMINEIKSHWGKEHKEKREFVHIEKMYRFLIEREEYSFNIDDITWEDLNMNEVFSKIDHTKSLPGMQYLYNMLRRPVFDNNELEKRNEIISSLQENKNISQGIQYELSKLGKKKGSNIFLYFENGINVDTKLAIIYKTLSYIPFLILILFFFSLPIAFFALITIIGVNTIIYQTNKYKIYEEMETFMYLENLISCAENITKQEIDILDLEQSEMKALLKKLKSIKSNVAKINANERFGSEIEILIHYYNMIVLREPNIFYKTMKLMNKYKEDIFRLYVLVGKIDAYISIASYRDSLKYYCKPDLKDTGMKFYLKADELYHPLLDNPVPYSFEMNNIGALITGSNASGKSTFLRTIGINSIFAQTINLVLAENYESSYFKLLTSIGTVDNVVRGDSYFMAEAKSLKRIIDTLDVNQPVLCILDEIFRGTNTAERISAALEALNYMIERNCCVVAATHDLELTSLVSDKYENYHFQESIIDDDIIFDYILRKGPCTSRNAIAILKYLNYPKEIYENALRRAETYLSYRGDYILD